MDPYIWQPVQWYSDASFVLVMQVKDNARSVSGGFSSQHQWERCLCLHLLPMIFTFINDVEVMGYKSFILLMRGYRVNFSWNHIQEYLFSLTIACTMKHFVGVMKTYILVMFLQINISNWSTVSSVLFSE